MVLSLERGCVQAVVATLVAIRDLLLRQYQSKMTLEAIDEDLVVLDDLVQYDGGTEATRRVRPVHLACLPI